MRKPTQSVKSFSEIRRASMRRCATGAWITWGILQLGGCAAQKPPPTVEHQSGSFNQPMVLSSRPKEDSAALSGANDSLSAADWRELEELGPRPIWERLVSRRPRPCDAARAAEHSTRSSTTQPALDESELPVQVINLPDGKVRLIWTLRNYGGPTVKSTRDAATARRTVEMAPPDLAPLVAVLMQNLGPATPSPRCRGKTRSLSPATKPCGLLSWPC